MLLYNETSNFPIRFVDHGGEVFEMYSHPRRVVCLTPSITEILLALGLQDHLVGITYHDASSCEGCVVVGGFLMPSIEKIKKAQPHVIFYSPIQEHIPREFTKGECAAIMLAPNTVEELFETIGFIGLLFERNKMASGLISRIQRQLELISHKLERASCKRPRVIRVMGMEGDKVLIPGKKSFQNLLISLAGGRPPEDIAEGNAAALDVEAWRRFDPQIIYGCEGDREVISLLSTAEGWRDVSAFRDGRCLFYPCELTCRLSVRVGSFVARLASDLYVEDFVQEETWLTPPHRKGERCIPIPLPYVKRACIVKSSIFDFENKSLLIEFTRPFTVVSTLEGMRRGVCFVGNHYSPPPCWPLTHRLGLSSSRELVYRALGLERDIASFLFTGADMDNLCIRSASRGKICVWVLVTAGVESNAQRMSRDRGIYYEPGTINMIIMCNMALTPRAMTKAIITATEAKTAALQDMDIRSSYMPLECQATGTGTDNIIVVEGEGDYTLDNAGGHSTLGELIARAVYEATIEAIGRQNSIRPSRDIFSRLFERGVDVYWLVSRNKGVPPAKKRQFLCKVDDVLLNPRYASFLHLCLDLSDGYSRRNPMDPSSLEDWCISMAEDIAGGPVAFLLDFCPRSWPYPLRRGLDAVLSGVFYGLDMGGELSAS